MLTSTDNRNIAIFPEILFPGKTSIMLSICLVALNDVFLYLLLEFFLKLIL